MSISGAQQPTAAVALCPRAAGGGSDADGWGGGGAKLGGSGALAPVDAATPRAEDGRTLLLDGRRCPRSRMGGALGLGWAAVGRRARGIVGQGGDAVTRRWQAAPSLADGWCPRSWMGGGGLAGAW
jgi:hypothetical protein